MTRAAVGYAYDNDSEHATDHHDALAELLDPFTRGRLSDLCDLRGRKVLEVGAGAGSMAIWLRDAVGPAGQVVATDIKPLISDQPRLRVS